MTVQQELVDKLNLKFHHAFDVTEVRSFGLHPYHVFLSLKLLVA